VHDLVSKQRCKVVIDLRHRTQTSTWFAKGDTALRYLPHSKYFVKGVSRNASERGTYLGVWGYISFRLVLADVHIRVIAPATAGPIPSKA
jgi:hypothetical protein